MPRHLTEAKRAIIVHLYKTGKSQREISKEAGVAKTTVANTIKRFAEQGNLQERKGRGRKKIVTPRAERTLVRLSLANRRLGSIDLCKELRESTGKKVCPSTVRRVLIRNGLKGCKPRKKPLLTEAHRKKRLEWAKQHQNWTVEQWSKVIFSDESNFTTQNHCGHTHVRRRVGEEYRPECLLPTIKHPTSVMIWGCFSMMGPGRLEVCEGRMNAERYLKVLEKRLLPSARDMYGADNKDWIYQQDNAPCHTAKKVKDWCQAKNIPLLPWPAQSPDMNPIENLWHQINLIVSKNKPTTKVQLIEEVIKAWHHVISQDRLDALVKSMPRRCRAVIKARGMSTKY